MQFFFKNAAHGCPLRSRDQAPRLPRSYALFAAGLSATSDTLTAGLYYRSCHSPQTKPQDKTKVAVKDSLVLVARSLLNEVIFSRIEENEEIICNRARASRKHECGIPLFVV